MPFEMPIKGTPFEMSTWGVMFTIGAIVILTWGLIARPKDFPYTHRQILIITLFMVFFGLIGARLLSVAIKWKYLAAMGYTLGRAVFRTKGFASLGGFAFELLTLLAFTKFREKKISFLVCADYGMPFLLLHQAFVRIGCFCAGCCLGLPTNLPWGVVFTTLPDHPRHPTQLYSVVFLIIIFITTRYIYKKKPPTGITFYTSLAMYGFFRYFVEQLRIDSVFIVGMVTLAELTMLSIFIFSVLMLLIIFCHSRKSGNP